MKCVARLVTTAADNNGNDERRSMLARGDHVFNAEPVDGFALPPMDSLPETECIDDAESFIDHLAAVMLLRIKIAPELPWARAAPEAGPDSSAGTPSGSETSPWIWLADRPSRMSRDENQTDCSPDGNWIYFGSGRLGTAQLWKMPAVGGEPIQITNHGNSHESKPSL